MGKMSEEVTTQTDSDWAGSKETRQSSSASEILIGKHISKACTRKHKFIARRSAESALYAAAWGASESIGIVSLLCDRGYVMKPVLANDAKAIQQGIGRLKCIDVAYLRISGRSEIHKIEGTQSQE